MMRFISDLSSKRWLRATVILGVLLFLFLSFSQTGLARELENQYPKIPLPNLPGLKFTQNYSLNDIAGRVGEFANLNPLSGLIFYLFTFAVSIVGLVAFGTIIYTGVMFVMSGARPQIRAQAMTRLRNTIFGIALLLGSVIILNTINPELTILNVPPVDWKKLSFALLSPFGTEIDPYTLRYGGVVVYTKPDLTGLAGKSDTLLGSLFPPQTNIVDYTYTEGGKLGALKILGNCAVRIGNISKKIYAIPGPISISANRPDGYSDVFNTKYTRESALIIDNTCLGHSIRVSTNRAVSGAQFRGKKSFIASANDLRNDWLPPNAPADNTINFFVFARPDLIEPIEDVAFSPEFNITTCVNPLEQRNQPKQCKTFSQKPLEYLLEISAIILGGSGKNRQAGVVLYGEDNFRGTSEVFIASDANFDGNLTGHDNVSSLQIIGKYKVTLYEKDLSDAGGGKTLIFDNTESSSAVLDIKKLSGFPLDDANSWDNKISAIKIEVPQKIYLEQLLGAAPCTTDLCEL